MDMNIKRFQCFMALAEELHFGRAAARLHMSQPPLSQQIQALEKEYGVRLFERSNRAVRLTPGGEALLPHARSLLACAARAEEAARRAQEGDAGLLRVGYVNPAMDGVLAGAVLALRRERPGVELSLEEMPSSAQAAALREGTLHLGFLRHGWLDLAGLHSRVVLRESYLLAVPEGHPFASREHVPLPLLDGEEIILYPRGSQPRLYDAMIAAFQKAGAQVRVAQEAVSKHTTLSLVAAGLGLALVPWSCRVWERKGVAYKQVEGELPCVELAAAWGRGAPVAALRLMELAVKTPNGESPAG